MEKLLKRQEKVHGDKYDYSLVTEYKNDRIKYPIICSEHGVFYQAFNNHIKAKQGCPICGRLKCDEARTMSTEEFITKSRIKHGDKYDYSQVVYIKSGIKVDIVCPEHGMFKQEPSNHLMGQGCPKCFKEKSLIERELFDFVREVLPEHITVEENNRTVLNGKEIDVYVPEFNLGFEMNGLIWHSDKFGISPNYHLDKTVNCLEKGVKLIHIFEDEWLFRKDICKHLIRIELGCPEMYILQEFCTVKEVPYDDAISFLEENHLRGSIDNDLSLGLYYNNDLIELMAFKKENDDYEILKHCYKVGTFISGHSSMLFEHFVKNYNPKQIIVLIDRGYENDVLYKEYGFKYESEIKPDYYFIESKFRFNKNICPEGMIENEFLEAKGFSKIYDCGFLKYKWK